MKKIQSILAIFLSSFSLYSVASCETHQTCPIGTLCQCKLTPSSGSERYFYFDFSGLKKNQIYQCKFTSSPGTLRLTLNQSTFPAGVQYQCSGECPKFPAELNVDTDKMEVNEEKMIIKYFVPKGDYVNDVTASCQIK